MMRTRLVGGTGIELSVVGFGTAQLQMVPERQAVASLVRAFELGVNWVHTAPDHGGIDPWIAKAIRTSKRQVRVLSAGPAKLADLEQFFEHTCHVYQTRRLALYGLSGIEDLEWHGENVFGRGGMVEFLQQKKAEGRLGGIYCSTHGSASYVVRLLESGVFDAIMLAWNPLGFHQQSQLFSREKLGRDYEDLGEYRQLVFPLAARRGVSLLIMKPFAGGLLCPSRAFPPHDWYAEPLGQIAAADVLRLILEEPAVCAVVPGTASVEEAEENARAGHATGSVPVNRRAQISRAAESMRASLCSHCGGCAATCSQGLPIPAMFRDAYIWTLGNETTMANPTENYFDLHPQPVLICTTCTARTCVCRQGIDIPAALERVHARMQALRAARQHPGPSTTLNAQPCTGRHRIRVHTVDVPTRLKDRQFAVARFLVQNVGNERWMTPQHTPDPAIETEMVVRLEDRLVVRVPLRNTVCPGERSPLVIEFRAPALPGRYELQFCLTSLRANDANGATVFHSGALQVEAQPRVRATQQRLARGVARLFQSTVAMSRSPAFASARLAAAQGAAYLKRSVVCTGARQPSRRCAGAGGRFPAGGPAPAAT
jgi:predicted aldo/keto reductase-like oxidoreductase